MKMNLDGAFLEVELPANFLVREAKGNEIDDFPLTWHRRRSLGICSVSIASPVVCVCYCGLVLAHKRLLDQARQMYDDVKAGISRFAACATCYFAPHFCYFVPNFLYVCSCRVRQWFRCSV
jgi:hypothetical protein